MIFRTGSILIVGKCNDDILNNVYEYIKNLLKDEASATGKTFLISSHDLQHVTEVSDRIVVLNKGKVVRDEKTSTDTP